MWVDASIIAQSSREAGGASPRRVENDGDCLLRRVPHRKVAAAIKPVELGAGKGCLRARSLSGEAEPVVPAPPDDDPAGAGSGGTGLLRSRGKAPDQRIERRRCTETFQLGRDGLPVKRPRTRGELREQRRARRCIPAQRRQAWPDGPQ